SPARRPDGERRRGRRRGARGRAEALTEPPEPTRADHGVPVMMIHDITKEAGKYKPRKRVGRGVGSGSGKTAGRGVKGAGSRSGPARKTAFEGGQMPYFRRIRKVGFSNFKFTSRFWIVNLREILDHPSFAKGGEVNAESMIAAGLIRDT